MDTRAPENHPSSLDSRRLSGRQEGGEPAGTTLIVFDKSFFSKYVQNESSWSCQPPTRDIYDSGVERRDGVLLSET